MILLERYRSRNILILDARSPQSTIQQEYLVAIYQYLGPVVIYQNPLQSHAHTVHGTVGRRFYLESFIPALPSERITTGDRLSIQVLYLCIKVTLGLI